MSKTNKQKNYMSKNLGQGLTFDDILLVPDYSEVLPKNVITKTKLTKNINLHIPFMSAAMDTVTESKMAIAMAEQGGIGIIHKNLSIADQAREVEKVKRYEAGRITNPVTLPIDATVGDVFAIQKKYHFGGFPVLDKNGFLAGIITNRDLRFQKDESTPIKKIMTTKLITGGPDTSIEEANNLFNKHAIEKLPLVDKNNKLVGLITYRDIAKSKEYPNAAPTRSLPSLSFVAFGYSLLFAISRYVISPTNLLFLSTSGSFSIACLLNKLCASSIVVFGPLVMRSVVITSFIFTDSSFWKRRSRLVTMPTKTPFLSITGNPPK